MAYDETLTARFRSALGGRSGIAEKRMMGGVCFLLNGNMIGGADRAKDGEGRFMFRVGKPNMETADALPGGKPMVQGGRTLSGLYFVSEEGCDEATFAAWLSLALSFAETLPPK